MMALVRRIFRRDEGEGRVRFALIIALAAIALAVSLGTMSDGINDTFNQIPASL